MSPSTLLVQSNPARALSQPHLEMTPKILQSRDGKADSRWTDADREAINFMSGRCSSSGLFDRKWSREMDFKEAVRSHLAWAWRLKDFIRGRELLDADSVAQDNRCPLGQWMYGEGTRHQYLDEFVELKELHAEFHRRAADIVRIAESGDTTAAAKRLEFGGAFKNLSSRLVEALHRLDKKIGAETGER